MTTDAPPAIRRQHSPYLAGDLCPTYRERRRLRAAIGAQDRHTRLRLSAERR